MQNNSLKLHVKTKLTLCHKMLYVLDDRTSCHCCWSYCYLCFLQHMIYVMPGPLQSFYKQLIWILKPEKELKKNRMYYHSGWTIREGRIIRSHITMKSIKNRFGQNYLQRNISALNIHFWLRTEFKSMPINWNWLSNILPQRNYLKQQPVIYYPSISLVVETAICILRKHLKNDTSICNTGIGSGMLKIYAPLFTDCKVWDL